MTSAPRWVAAVAAAGLLAVGCSGEESPEIELAPVTSGEVIETVAAPATIEAAGKVTVTAPAGGEVIELLVEDGDVVEQGDVLLRVASDSVDLQIAQARAALDAAGALGGVSTGVDLSPIVGAVREQLETVVPGFLADLAEQAASLPEGPLREQALARIGDARRDYERSRQALLEAEQEAAASAEQASAAQRRALEAQQEQAQVALEAARERADELVVRAPTAGTVELARGGDGGGAGGVPDLGGLESGGQDLSGLLGSSGGVQRTGPLSVGDEVPAGGALVTLFDLSGFHAAADIDELDAVEVSDGQDALILVDAYPDVELDGFVDHIAIEPERGATGGTIYPATVRLRDVPDDVRLLVGLTASVEIEVDRLDADVVVPSSALLRRGGQEVVYVARDGVADEVPVEVLAIGEDEAAVSGDLEAGEQVVTLGIEGLSDGDPLP